MIEWKSGVVQTIDKAQDICYKFISKGSYKFCSGIDPDYYNTEYYEVISTSRVSGKQLLFLLKLIQWNANFGS